MAFIRAYMEQGDPFRFRLPRFLKPPRGVRRIAGKAFRFARKLAPVAGFIPGLQPLALAGRLGKVGRLGARVAGGFSRANEARTLLNRMRAERAAAEAAAMAAAEEEEEDVDLTDEYEPEELEVARSYGYEVGDPGTVPKRKGAASGPRAKAAKKRAKRATKRAGGEPRTGPQKRRPRGGSRGGGRERPKFDITGALGEFARGGGLEAAAGAFRPGKGGMRALGFGGRRRAVNPGNVKALRRSLRRVDSFAKLARKVQKDAAGILRHVDRPRAASMGRTRGHKAGCRCVVCARAA